VPSQTLYLQNLNHKTKKTGTHRAASHTTRALLLTKRATFSLTELKRALHLCFSAHGRVLDVVCLKTSALRGQAWVVFADVPSATSALRALQGFTFYDRPLVRGKGVSAGSRNVTDSPPFCVQRSDSRSPCPSQTPWRSSTGRGCRRTSE